MRGGEEKEEKRKGKKVGTKEGKVESSHVWTTHIITTTIVQKNWFLSSYPKTPPRVYAAMDP